MDCKPQQFQSWCVHENRRGPPGQTQPVPHQTSSVLPHMWPDVWPSHIKEEFHHYAEAWEENPRITFQLQSSRWIFLLHESITRNNLSTRNQPVAALVSTSILQLLLVVIYWQSSWKDGLQHSQCTFNMINSCTPQWTWCSKGCPTTRHIGASNFFTVIIFLAIFYIFCLNFLHTFLIALPLYCSKSLPVIFIHSLFLPQNKLLPQALVPHQPWLSLCFIKMQLDPSDILHLSETCCVHKRKQQHIFKNHEIKMI